MNLYTLSAYWFTHWLYSLSVISQCSFGFGKLILSVGHFQYYGCRAILLQVMEKIVKKKPGTGWPGDILLKTIALLNGDQVS
jgi:hypothetical protein